MPAEWRELNTDAEWDPWLFGQLYATVAGWSNGEAVAVQATSINDAGRPAARWRNVGGGGASVWEAADGTKIAEAVDAGFNLSKALSGTSGSFSGALSAAGGAFAVNGTTGAITGSSASFSGNVSAGSLTISGGFSATNATFTGNVVLGDANTDTHTVIGGTTFRNAANTATQLLVDAGNNRVVVGSGTAIGSDTTPNLQVVGRLYVAPESANDTALQIRRSSGATTGWTIGVENSPVNLAFKDDSDTKVVAFGDAGAAYQLAVTGDASISDNLAAGGDFSADRILAGAVSFPSGTYALAIDGDLRLDGYTSSSGGAAPAAIDFYWHVSFGGTTLKIPLYV